MDGQGSKADILTAEDVLAAPAAAGGKGRNLALLARAGLPVPPFLAVSCAALDALLDPHAERVRAALDGLSDGPAAHGRVAAEIHAMVREVGLPEGLSAALSARLAATFPAGASFAVRSSAADEDSASASFAGQMDSFLHVPAADVPARLLDCLGSAWSGRALAYRLAHGYALQGIRAGAIVQLMVESRAAGVLFTSHPSTGDAATAVIVAGLGLGEGIVGDLVETDTYVADAATGSLRSRDVTMKAQRVERDGANGRGTRIALVPEADRDRPVLSDAEIASLVALGRSVVAALGPPQDIEWAIDGDGRIHLLQARPITTLGDGPVTVYDNANIVESYPGLSLPLTFSFARTAYARTFRQGSRTLGVPERTLRENRDAHESLLAHLDGRIYYNLSSFYRILALVPGFEGWLPAWEKALGLPPSASAPSRGVRMRQLPLVLRAAFRLLWHFARLDGDVGRFKELFARVHADFRAHDLRALPPERLFRLYQELSDRLLEPYAISVVNDLLAQQLYELLARLIARYGLGDPSALRNDLVAGDGGMESMAPLASALALAQEIRSDAALAARFSGPEGDAALWSAVREEPALADLRKAMDLHLEQYGDRTLEELKLETPPLSEEPARLVGLLRNYLAAPPAAGSARGRARAEAQAGVARRLRLHPIRRTIFRFVLSRSRATLRHREDLRLLRSRAFGMCKRIFRRIGSALAERGVLSDMSDIFYLAVPDVESAIHGTVTGAELASIVMARRRAYEVYSRRTLPQRIVARGPIEQVLRRMRPGLADERQSRDGAAPSVESGAAVLRGTGSSPGRARAPARVVRAPRADLEVRGEILVAPMTDPGWVFLMAAASGLVVERGSLLSHSAIIGRELGIPTVVGVRAATRLIAEGQEIEVDGDAGVVRLRTGPACGG